MCGIIEPRWPLRERLQIVRLLADGPHNVTQITEALKIPPLNVSHHLTVLKTAHLIQGEKKGRFVIYSLCDHVLNERGPGWSSQGIARSRLLPNRVFRNASAKRSPAAFVLLAYRMRAIRRAPVSGCRRRCARLRR
ncbi:MAG: metalloregulator ArsR/SmtB family transcription factor [Gemmataceae bacterium]